HESRDLAGGPVLVLGVGRVGRHRPLPPLRPLVAGDLARDHVLAVRAVLELYRRVRPEVVVPLRIGGGTALRGDGRVPPVVLDPHHRGLAQLAAADPAVGDDHHGQAGAAQRRAPRPAPTFVLFHLLPDPRPRAGLVIVRNWHAASQAPRRWCGPAGPVLAAAATRAWLHVCRAKFPGKRPTRQRAAA